MQSRADKRETGDYAHQRRSEAPARASEYSIIIELKQGRNETRLAPLLSDYKPSAPSFSAIRTKSASEEAPIFRMTCRR